jgi:hypothetical protein
VAAKLIKFVATVEMNPPCSVTQTQAPIQNWPDLLRYHKRRQEVDIIDTEVSLSQKLKIDTHLKVVGKMKHTWNRIGMALPSLTRKKQT